MREPGGMEPILAAVERLSKCHPEHISQYGLGNEERLSGKHETCDINTFRHGEGGEGAGRCGLGSEGAGKVGRAQADRQV